MSILWHYIIELGRLSKKFLNINQIQTFQFKKTAKLINNNELFYVVGVTWMNSRERKTLLKFKSFKNILLKIEWSPEREILRLYHGFIYIYSIYNRGSYIFFIFFFFLSVITITNNHVKFHMFYTVVVVYNKKNKLYFFYSIYNNCSLNFIIKIRLVNNY